MLMRFHPGLAIGHTYHDFESVAGCHSAGPYGSHGHDLNDPAPEASEDSKSVADSDGTMDSMDGGWEGWEDEGDYQDNRHIDGSGENSDDEEFLALHEMYE